MSKHKDTQPRWIHRHRKLVILAGIMLLVAAACYFVYREYKASTTAIIKNSPGSTYMAEIPNSKTRTFDEAAFSFDAPADWELTKHTPAPYNLYSFHSTLKNADNRYLDIYVDNVPRALAVNKVLAVKAQNNILSHGEVSENCTTLMTGPKQTAGSNKQLAVPVHWDGVDFLCDNDSTLRNVIGTSSPEGVNSLTLKSASGTPHQVFFVYTDNNSTPDYSIFYNMLDSFKIK